MKTSYIKAKEVNKKWHVVDATGKTLGRLSSRVAQVLRGKQKVNYTPHMDMGDFVIIINAEKVLLTGNKEEQKEYFRHTNYPGGAKTSSLKLLRTKNPEFILKNAVKGMLPHNRLGKKILEHLKIYVGNNHPHDAQNPSKLEL
jgi:large subunit ribosomal protein L13